jgi:nucleotide-binding universal stress UspA family protein
MFPPKKILFPVDFSDRCSGAAHFVEALVGRFDAELTLLHVVEPVDYLYGSLEFGGTSLNDYHAERINQCRRQLDEYLMKELEPFQVRRLLAEGDPAHKIAEISQQEGIDLVMMPSHGFGPFRRFIIGSVTAKALHDLECSVWTGVHMEAAPPLEQIGCRSVLCAADLGPQSERALKYAGQVAEEYGAELRLVHATPVCESRPGKYMDSEFYASLVGKAREELQHLIDRAGVTAEICIDGGDPAEIVHQVAAKFKADLVVIGRGSAAGGFGRLRTHAYAIIRRSPCPVISV